MSADPQSPNSIDSEVEILMVAEQILSKKQKRLKLLDYLLYSPPPEPLHWVSFHDYVVKQFGTYYQEQIIREVFHLIDKTITKTRYVSAVIDLNSDDEGSASHALSENIVNEKRDSCSQALSQPISINDSCDGTLEDPQSILSFSPADTPFSEEIDDLKKDRIVKKIFGDIYGILKEINDSTSCRICTKLKYRLVKFQDIVTNKDSEQVEIPVQSEQETNREKQLKERRTSMESKNTSYYEKLGSTFLTEKEVEKIREAILLDKLLGLTYRDVITSAENQKSIPNLEYGKPELQLKPKSKKKTSEANTIESFCLSKASKKAKKTSKRRSSAQEISLDSTESFCLSKASKKAKKTSKRRSSSQEIPSDSTESFCLSTASKKAKKTSKRRNSAQEISLDSTESFCLSKASKKSKKTSKRRNSAQEISLDSTESFCLSKASKKSKKTLKRRSSAQEIPPDSTGGFLAEGQGIKCTKCGRHYKLKSSLINHRKWECGKEPQFQCPYCNYRAKQKTNLAKHIGRMHHETLIEEEKEVAQ